MGLWVWSSPQLFVRSLRIKEVAAAGFEPATQEKVKKNVVQDLGVD